METKIYHTQRHTHDARLPLSVAKKRTMRKAFTPLEVPAINGASRLGTALLTGFTMVELMAVLIIIGLLATLVATRVVSKIDQAKLITTKANLKIFHTAVNQFKMDTGRFPTEDEGLDALIDQPTDVENYEPGGYLETTEIPRDGWGRDFIYERYPESGKPFVIKSYGADGEEGGEEYEADLLSTDAY